MTLSKVFNARACIGLSRKDDLSLTNPFEDSEEIRLLLVESALCVIDLWTFNIPVIVKMIRECSNRDKIIDRVNDIYQTLPNLLLDPFPDLKRASCQLLIGMSKIFPFVTIRHMRPLLIPVIGYSPKEMTVKDEPYSRIDLMQCIIHHRHYRTRILALKVVSNLLHCFSAPSSHLIHETDNTDIVSIFQNLSSHIFSNIESSVPFDKNISVRMELSKFVCDILEDVGLLPTAFERLDALNQFASGSIPRLIVLMMLSLSDESEDVRNTISSFLECRCHNPTMLARPYQEQVLKLLLNNIQSNSSLAGKVKFLGATRELIQHLNSTLNIKALDTCWTRDSVLSILESLTKCLTSEEKDIFSAVREVSYALGQSIDSSQLAIVEITKAILGDSDTPEVIHFDTSKILMISTSKQCSIIMFILSAILNGSAHNKNKNDFRQLLKALTSSKILAFSHEDKDTALSLMNVIQSFCNFDIEDEESMTNLLMCTINLLGNGNESNIQSGTLSILRDISARNNSSNLLDDYFIKLLSRLLIHETEWVYGDRDLFAFDALIRFATKRTVCRYFNEVGTKIESYLVAKIPKGLSKDEIHQKFQTKLFFMALLESIISNDPSSNAQLHPFVQKMIQNALIPNLIWQPGGAMACATRKLAAATLFSLLQGDVITDFIMCKIASVLIPVLKTCLRDDDPSTRELVALSLAKIFEFIGGLLNKDDAIHLLNEILQCLDDDSKSVRIASCDALTHLLRSSPAKHYEESVIDAMVGGLLVYLNDPDLEVNERVMKVLHVATTVGPSTVLNAASKALARCPDSECYRTLVTHAQQLQL